MRKKILLFCLGLCLFVTACSGKGSKEEGADQSTVQNDADSAEESQKAAPGNDKSGQKENSKKDKKSQSDKQEPEPEKPGQELSNVPEVTFTDYSQNIQDEESGVLLLAVTEN